jgi:hypothetical protein
MITSDFEGSKNNAMKINEDNQYPLDVEGHQMPDHLSNFMKMIRGNTWPI